MWPPTARGMARLLTTRVAIPVEALTLAEPRVRPPGAVSAKVTLPVGTMLPVELAVTAALRVTGTLYRALLGAEGGDVSDRTVVVWSWLTFRGAVPVLVAKSGSLP